MASCDYGRSVVQSGKEEFTSKVSSGVGDFRDEDAGTVAANTDADGGRLCDCAGRYSDEHSGGWLFSLRRCVLSGRRIIGGGIRDSWKVIAARKKGSAVEWDWGTLGFDRESRTVRKTF